MAERVRRVTACDMGGQADGAETVRFALDGQLYEIDLCEMHRREFTSLTAEFTKHGRKTGTPWPRAGGQRPRNASSRRRSREVRAWAQKQGIEIGERGRIPVRVIRQYHAR